VKPLHHRVAVGIHCQHGKSEHFIPLWVALLPVDTGNAHGNLTVLLNQPTHSFAGFPAWLEKVLGRDNAALTFGP
jgi:hypothetical protein